MKTEDFDDALRNKLQGITRPATEAQVDAVFKYVSNKRGARSYSRYVGYSAITVAALLVVSLLYWNIILNNKQNQLVKEVESLSRKLDNAENKISQTQVPESSTQGNTNVEEHRKDATNAGSTEVGNQKTYSSKGNTKYESTKQKINNGNEKPEAVNNSPASTTSASDSKTTPAEKTPIVAEEEKPASPKTDTVNTSSTTEEIAAEVKPDESRKKEIAPEPPIRKKAWLNLKPSFATGFGIEAGQDGIGYSLIEELKLNKSIGISTGIKMLVQSHERFEGPHEFYYNKHEDINKRYENHPIDTEGLHNIDIQCKYYQVPINISYYMPIQNAFALVFGAGTNLTFNALDNVRYANSKTQQGGSDAVQTLVVKKSALSFRDINLSVGLQKKWNRFSVDLSPTVGFKMAATNEHEKPVFTSYRLRLMYRI